MPSRVFLVGLLAIGLVASLVAGQVPVPAQAGPGPAPPDLCDVETAGRVVAVGDVHGAYDAFVRILRRAALIDENGQWSGGTATFVQVGDVVDRGDDSRSALELLQRLEGEAAAAGGRVIVLLGNHEVMVMMRDLRYVSAAEYAAFASERASELREAYYSILLADEPRRARAAGRVFDEAAFRELFLAQVPLGFVEMQVAFEPDGQYGRWLRTLGVIARINGVVFIHGGVTPALSLLGCEGIAERASREVADLPAADDPRARSMLLAGSAGPLWNRDLALDESPLTGADVGRMLDALDARAIVIGHTPVAGGRVRTRFDDRVIQIDTGMLERQFYPGGRPSALQIDGDQVTVFYEDRQDELFRLPAR